MKKKLLWFIVILLLMVTGFSFFPKQPIPQQIAKALEMFSHHFYQEKVYLQFDKDYYVAGSTIWYKGYVTLDRKPTTLSSILYIDLLNDSGRVIQRNKRPIEDGGAYGDFALDSALHAGNYRVRAYTLWMRNFDSAFFFTRDIHIYNPEEEQSENAKERKALTKFSVQFFPEGGTLVDSLKSLVAFKAINENGLPLKVKGLIKNTSGEIMDTIQSVHDGMGSFELTPHAGADYIAIMKDMAGHKQVFKLPDVQSEGVVLKVMKLNNNRIYFRVKRHFKNTEVHNNFELVAQSQGKMTYMAGIDFNQGYIGGVIPTKNASAGILQITLFSEAGIPLAERLVFLKKKKETRLNVALKTDTLSLDPRGKNVYSIRLLDSVQGNFSVSVTDADQALRSPNQDNIVSNLLMTNDIKGVVYNPAWYFQGMDSARKKGLELVMLTNGWRRFEWKKIMQGNYPEIQYVPEPNGLYFIGKLKDKDGPVEGGMISVILKSKADSSSNFMFGASQKGGLFKLNHLSFEGKASLFYKAKNPEHKHRKVKVEIEDSVAPIDSFLLGKVYTENPPSKGLKNMLSLSEERRQIANLISNRSILLKGVEVTADKKSKKESMEDKYTDGRFKTRGGYTFDLTDRAMPYSNILQFLVGKVAGLQVRAANPTNPSISWRGGTPGFFIDEIPADIDQIMNIPVTNVAFIKVFRPPFMAGFGGANGGIAIYLRRGSDVRMPSGKGLDKMEVQGYSLVKTFYSPDYSIDKSDGKIPDKRATLYWNPQLIADSLHHVLKIPFYNSDIAKQIRVSVEGITQDGRLVHIDKIIK